MLQAGEEQDARRLDRTAGHDHEVRVHRVRHAVGPDVLDPGGPAPTGDDAADVGLGHELGPAGRHGLRQEGHGVALGVDGTAEERAEAAVVAGRAPVVGDAVGRRRRLVGVEPDLLRRSRREHGAVHGRPGRHRVGARPPGRERVGPLASGHADGPLDFGVVRLELVVVDRPVVDRGVLLRAIGREEPEVLLPEAGHLAVGVRPATADRGGDRVHLTDMGVLPLVRRAPERAGLDERIRTEEVAGDELDLVVGVVAGGLRGVVGVEEVVAPLLHDDHRPAGAGQHLGRRRTPRSRTDDDRVGRHGWDTSASL